MTNWTPITKIVATFLGAGITWVALQLGVDVDSAAVNEAAAAVVGIVVGYLVPDPRVS